MTEQVSTSSAAEPASRRTSWGVWLMLGVVLLLLAVVAVQLVRVQQGPLTSGPVPDFTLTTFDGEEIQMSALRGQVVVINFWASWCGPCELEAAELEQFWRDNKDRGVMLIGVNWSDVQPDALAYMAKFDITYPSGVDVRTRISQQFRIDGVPETYIIDKQGNIREAIIGPTTYANLTRIIEELLAE